MTHGSQPDDPGPVGLTAQLVETGAIRSQAVATAFTRVRRHVFVPEASRDMAYQDVAIPTKRRDGVPISSSSQPSIMAIMLEQLALEPGQRVLEIGAGTGYNAALMAEVVGQTGHVVTVDIDDDIVADAQSHLRAAGYGAVDVVCGDGALGWPAGAPYDRIILTVGAWDIAPAWREQLKPGGRLVLPLSLGGQQESIAFERVNEHLHSRWISPCGFMTLRGQLSAPDAMVRIGPTGGVFLSLDDSGRIDAHAMYRLLHGPSSDSGTGVTATLREVWGSLTLWLAVHDGGYCIAGAEGEAAVSGILPALSPPHGGFSESIGLAEGDMLCLLTRRALPADMLQGSGETMPFELLIRSYGSSAPLAQRLGRCIADWDRAGRPMVDRLTVEAYPNHVSRFRFQVSGTAGARVVANTAESGDIVLHKPLNDYVLRWH